MVDRWTRMRRRPKYVRIGLHEFLHCFFRHVRVLEDEHCAASVGEGPPRKDELLVHIGPSQSNVLRSIRRTEKRIEEE